MLFQTPAHILADLISTLQLNLRHHSTPEPMMATWVLVGRYGAGTKWENGPRNWAIKSRKGYFDRWKVNTYVKGLRLAARETGCQTSGSLCLSAVQTRRKGWRINEQKAVTSAARASVPALTGGGSNVGEWVGSSASPQVGHAAKCETYYLIKISQVK